MHFTFMDLFWSFFSFMAHFFMQDVIFHDNSRKIRCTFSLFSVKNLEKKSNPNSDPKTNPNPNLQNIVNEKELKIQKILIPPLSKPTTYAVQSQHSTAKPLWHLKTC